MLGLERSLFNGAAVFSICRRVPIEASSDFVIVNGPSTLFPSGDSILHRSVILNGESKYLQQMLKGYFGFVSVDFTIDHM